jgi:transposase
MAAHYDTAIVPARPGKPRDKAKVEVGVQVATRWITAKLRNRRLFSLSEINAAIAELVGQINGRVTRHLDVRHAEANHQDKSLFIQIPIRCRSSAQA